MFLKNIGTVCAIVGSGVVAGSASAQSLFSSDGTDLAPRFGLTGSAGTAPDGSAALVIEGEPTATFSDLLSPGLIAVPGSDLGSEFVLSLDVYIPSGSNLDSGVAFIRFYDDADDSGSLSFDPGGEFANRVEFFGDSIDFTVVDAFQTIQVTGTIPTVDAAGGEIDVLQFNLGLGQQGGATGAVSAFVNNVSLTVVPEPASLVLAAVGGLALVARRRRA